ncbi:MAG: arsenic resistance N-acetyltransferase ArsN2 [Opitutaceae bacterium]|nr:arsenic resistance N-acetyltransferase ArsN2 [Opitutaceae bacterium]
MKAPPSVRIVVKSARAEDVAAIVALLQDAGLPHEGIGTHLNEFLVARVGEEVVGAVGLEVHGTAALLRSLVVAPELRGKGLGEGLTGTIVARAASLGVQQLYLLTTTAAHFFARRGFTAIARGNVPAGIAGTEEFKSLCPASAVCMQRLVKP